MDTPNKKTISSQQIVTTSVDSEKQITTVEASIYQGLIPPPEMMEKYHQIDASFPSRILAIAEQEGKARRDLNNSIVNKSFWLDIFSTICALLAVVSIVWLCHRYLVANQAEYGKDIAEFVIVALASVFIGRKFISNKSKPTESINKKGDE